MKKTIISKTSENELKAAVKHLIYAKSHVSHVIMKGSKRNQNNEVLTEVYKEIYQANEKLENALKKCEVRLGFK